MPRAASPDEVAATLNEVCRTAVAVGRSGDPARIAAFTESIALRAEELGEASEPSAFLHALALVVSGADPDVAGADLGPAYRQALGQVAADMAGGEEEDAWVYALTARVGQVLQRRDRDAARALAAQIQSALATPDLDPSAGAYLRLLLAVLAGRDTRAASLALSQPYRSAYFGLVSLVREGGPVVRE